MSDPVSARIFSEVWSGDPAVVVASPPGAGKTWLAANLALALSSRAGLRVGIAAQTRSQAIEIASRISGRTDAAALMWKKDTPAPGSGSIPLLSGATTRWPLRGGGILIGTTARWMHSDPARIGADVLLVEEAWQCTWADLGALAAMADQLVCVGDPGQIAPVVTGETSRWDGSPTAPNLPGPEGLAAAYPDAVTRVELAHTRRLGPATTELIQPIFYPDLPFTSKRPTEYLVDEAGCRLPELAQRSLAATEGPTDPKLIAACVDRVRELLTSRIVTEEGERPAVGRDIAVVVPHVAQSAAVMAALSDEPEVLVGTANSLQGLERQAVVTLHPLAGYRLAAPFALEPGRACVMLSRHRAHVTVIHDEATPSVLEHTEPSEHLALQRALITDLGELPAA